MLTWLAGHTAVAPEAAQTAPATGPGHPC